MTIFRLKHLKAAAVTCCAALALIVPTAGAQRTDPQADQQDQTQQQQTQQQGAAERQAGAEGQMPATASPIGILLLGGIASVAAGAALRRRQ